MRSAVGSPLAALRRSVALVLLIAVPLAILSSHLAVLLGPMHLHLQDHDHRSASAQALLADVWGDAREATAEHHHQRGVIARHRHDVGDRSVIIVAADRADDGVAGSDTGGGNVKPLPLAAPLRWDAAAAEPDASAWPAALLARWTDHVPPRPERPPRGR